MKWREFEFGEVDFNIYSYNCDYITLNTKYNMKPNGEFNMLTQYDDGYLFVHYNSLYRIYNPYLLEPKDELEVDDFIVEDREFNQYILEQPLSNYSIKATNEPWYDLAVEACKLLLIVEG